MKTRLHVYCELRNAYNYSIVMFSTRFEAQAQDGLAMSGSLGMCSVLLLEIGEGGAEISDREVDEVKENKEVEDVRPERSVCSSFGS